MTFYKIDTEFPVIMDRMTAGVQLKAFLCLQEGHEGHGDWCYQANIDLHPQLFDGLVKGISVCTLLPCWDTAIQEPTKTRPENI